MEHSVKAISQPEAGADLGFDLQHPKAGAAGNVEESPRRIVVADSRVHQRSVVEVGYLARLCRLADVEDPQPGAAEIHRGEMRIERIVDQMIGDPRIAPRS